MARSLLPSAVAIAVLAAPAGAGAHERAEGDGAPVPLPRAAPGSGEAGLRAVERQALGAEHAREHAEMRALASRAQRRRANRLLRGRDERLQLQRSAAPRAAPVVSPRIGGSWSEPVAMPPAVIGINAVLLPTGKVLVFSYPGRPKDWSNGTPENGIPGTPENNLAHAWVIDPTGASAPRQVDPPLDAAGRPTNIWCSGATLLADGRVLVAGGNFDPDPTRFYRGIRSLFTFDPFSETWTRQPSMRQGRWYPTTTLMPDGRALIMGGYSAPGDADFNPANTTTTEFNRDLEIFTPGTSPVGSLELNGLKFANPDGGGSGANGPRTYGQYNRLFWMPSGRIFSAGPFAVDSWFLNPGPAGQAWGSTSVPDPAVSREWGTAVLLQDGKVLTMGGSDVNDGPGDARRDNPATPADEDPYDERSEQASMAIFDEGNPGAGWQPRRDMSVGRSNANSVLLPDGKVATIGGGRGNRYDYYYRWKFTEAQTRPELYDPVADTAPVLGNPQAEGRTYHSTALLLPDGRVLSAGDDINGPRAAADDPGTVGDETIGEGTGTRSDTYEIWSPPYLFNADGAPAPRPSLDSAPATAAVGSSFDVRHSGPAPASAALVSPGAPTHAFDMHQRRVPLAVSAGADGCLRLTVPADEDVALPGYHMLFLLDAAGTPSVARWVRVGRTGPAFQACPPQPGPPPETPPQPPQPPPPEPPKAPEPPRPRVAKLTIATGKLPSGKALARARRLTVTVKLAGARGRVDLALAERRRFRALAPRRTLRFTTVGTRRVTFVLTPAGRRILQRERKVRLRVRASATLSSGRRLAPVQALRTLR